MRFLYPLGFAYGVIVLGLQYISIQIAFFSQLTMDLLLFLYFIKQVGILLLRYLVIVVLWHFFLILVSIFNAHFCIGLSVLRWYYKVFVIVSKSQSFFCWSQRYFAIGKLPIFEEITLNIKFQFALLRINQLVALIFSRIDLKELNLFAGSMCRCICFEIIGIDNNIVYFTLDFLLFQVLHAKF